jgi:hypothetical protein
MMWLRFHSVPSAHNRLGVCSAMMWVISGIRSCRPYVPIWAAPIRSQGSQGRTGVMPD